MALTLRKLEDADLEKLFGWEQDPAAIEMAAFTRPIPSDRASFDAHYARIRNDSSVLLYAIDNGTSFVGTVASFRVEDSREVTYWIDRDHWNQGIASAALQLFLRRERKRPLNARAANHNVGSSKVLTRAGFKQIATETSFACGVGRDVVECIFRLDS